MINTNKKETARETVSLTSLSQRVNLIIANLFHLLRYFYEKLLTNETECDIIFKHDLYAPVAQLVEHLTFNQGVRDSSSRRSTRKIRSLEWVFFYVIQGREFRKICANSSRSQVQIFLHHFKACMT